MLSIRIRRRDVGRSALELMSNSSYPRSSERPLAGLWVLPLTAPEQDPLAVEETFPNVIRCSGETIANVLKPAQDLAPAQNHPPTRVPIDKHECGIRKMAPNLGPTIMSQKCIGRPPMMLQCDALAAR